MTSPEPERHEDDLDAWRPPKPLPPVPKFPEIPKELREKGQNETVSNLTGFGEGWAVALDFVCTIVAGFLIGFGIDWWLKTRPWGTLIGLGVGFAYAIVRIMQYTQRQERKARK